MLVANLALEKNVVIKKAWLTAANEKNNKHKKISPKS